MTYTARPIDKDNVVVPRAHEVGVKLVVIRINLFADLNDPAFSVLDDVERTYASRFILKEDAIRFSTTRVALREMLAELLDVPPYSLRFERDENGRPKLTSRERTGAFNAIDFNVSHSGHIALIALAEGRRVGVDIEACDRRIDWSDLAPTVFTQRDQAYIISLPEHLRSNAFYDAWTAKEAFLKAFGTGFATGTGNFSVLSKRNDFPVAIPEPPLSDCDVRLLEYVTALDGAWCPAPTGYTACVTWSRERTSSTS